MCSLSAVVIQNSKEHGCKILLFGHTRHTLESIAICSFQYGLYSAFMGCFVYIVFGKCKDITIGPTALMALMTHQQIVRRNVDFAILLCFLTGIAQLLMAVLHLGTYVLLRLHICKGNIRVFCVLVCRHVMVFVGVHVVLSSGLRSCSIELVCVMIKLHVLNFKK